MAEHARRVPLERCDLVMKGGATSGVIYPPVIAELAEKYQFDSIGGTSAGAIAAAVTAAAEYGRKRGYLKDFSAMNRLSDEISQPGMLLTLFRSTAPAHLRPVLDTLLPLVSNPHAAEGAPPPVPGGGDGLPRPPAWLAPELMGLLTLGGASAAPGAPAQGPGLGRTVGRVVGALPETHPRAFAEGERAGALAGGRVGGYLVGAAALLAALFALPLLAGATPVGWGLWLLLAAALLGGALWLRGRLTRTGGQLGGTAAALVDLVRLLLEEVPKNLYGICTGRRQEPPEGQEAQPALTDWLSGWIDSVAGPTDHGGPPTFADLRAEGIELKMVTTNLTHARPYELPFEGDFILLFRRGDMERLFPPGVVRHLTDPKHLYPGWSLDALNEGKAEDDPDRFFMLPNSLDLPIVVGMRMSLSFPLLISAVRLYTVAGTVEQRDGMYMPRLADLQENWFSDGGICSNFPIHFFDRWLPTHPTFGINLTALPPVPGGAAPRPGAPRPGATLGGEAGEAAPPAGQVPPEYFSRIAPDAPVAPVKPAGRGGALLGGEQAAGEAREAQRISSQAARVLLPDAAQPLDPIWRPIESISRFLWSMFDTAMNYRDTTQLMLPSYKERAVQIRLDGTREGGLNLNMPKETVRSLQEYGRAAGRLLRTEFDFNRHRWVRFRVLMGELERQMLSLDAPLSAAGEAGDGTLYEELIREARAAGFPFSDAVDDEWVAAADSRLRALRALIGAWREANREEHRAAGLTSLLLALTEAWRQDAGEAAGGDQLAAELEAVIARWRRPGPPPRYVGREVRFFKPVGTSQLELRVTPEL